VHKTWLNVIVQLKHIFSENFNRDRLRVATSTLFLADNVLEFWVHPQNVLPPTENGTNFQVYLQATSR
jgi:hypothetical protein